jgi:hypothetical protein
MPQSDLTLEESFRLALREAVQSDLRDLLLETLLASARDNEALQAVANEELAPRAAHLELHLDGDNVFQHSTNAKSFGAFVSRIAEASKEFVKDRLHVDRLASDILIAPGPGSVRATFFAPDPVNSSEHTTLADASIDGGLWRDTNLQSESLHRIATVLSNADPDSPESDALDGAIQQLPLSARRHLRSAVREVAKQEWNISGEFWQRGIGIEIVAMKPSSARYLSDRLAVQEIERGTWVSTGVLDGHKWSTGMMFFIPGGNSRPIPASFATTEIQQQVAALAAVADQQVKATFTVYTQHGAGTPEAGRRSYVIEKIESISATADMLVQLEEETPTARELEA